MSDDYDDDLSDDQIDEIVQSAVLQLLNLAAGVAELQATDQAAEDIYVMCDLIAEYHGIELAKVITEENADGSYTTRFESAPDVAVASPTITKDSYIPGSIRNRSKFRLSDIGNSKNK